MSETSAISNQSEVDRSEPVPSAKDFLEKILDLKLIISQDLLACDAKWTLFVSAALSYRHDSQLKPYPPQYVTNNNQYNIDRLVNTINQTPPLRILLKSIIEENYDEIVVEVIELLHWVLYLDKDPYLRSVPNEEFDKILQKVSQVQKVIRPTHIFEVRQPRNSKHEEVFENQRKEFKTNFAFHGSKLDSFYSILNYGLQQHMCKNGLFGEGIYLSSELSVSLNFSPNRAAWGSSAVGSILSCVAICEYIENPEHLNCHVETDKKSNVPKTYYVITNNEIVRIRYLLFFGSPLNRSTTRSVALAWINKNKYFLTVCCYTAFLATIGIANSGHGSYLRHIITKKTNDLMNGIQKMFDNDN